MAYEKSISILPIPMKTVRKIGKSLRGVGSYLTFFDKKLDERLYQSGLNMKPSEYMGVTLFTSLLYGSLSFILVAAVSFSENNAIGIISPIVGLLIMSVSFLFVLTYPRTIIARLSKETDQDMLAAMRHFVIEIRSGVPLFNAMASISHGYAQVSDEFRKIVNDMNAGMRDVDALNRAAERNKSIFFRRVIWQLVNAIKSGSDISKTMEDVIKSLTKNQELKIRKYGQELNPLTMMYMIMSVIFPSLGVTFLIILSSFAGIAVPGLVYPLIIIFLIIFQFFFIGFIKTRKPNISV